MFSGIAEEFKGEKLYKYYSYNNNTNEMFAPILNLTLRYRTPNSFNDPYDCYIAAKLNGKIQSVRANQMNEVFVCSLTSSSHDILMWSHYASNHKGFVVEYNLNELKKIPNSQMETFSKVTYSDDIPLRNFFSSNADAEIVNAIYHKASCWKYENEIRSVIYGSSQNPYKDLKLENNCISGVILGSHFMKERNGKIPNFLKSWKEENKLYYMQLLSDKYELEKRSDIEDNFFE